MTDPVPDPNPLMMTIFDGALCESMRVQLFSSPQQQQARIARSEYVEKDKEEMSLSERSRLATVIRKIAKPNLRDLLLKEKQGDQRGGDDLEVVEK